MGTDKRVIILLVSTFLFLSFPSIVFAASPTECPAGFHLEKEGDDYCCDGGSVDVGGNVCKKSSDGSPAWGTQDNTDHFCPKGYLLLGEGTNAGSPRCFSAGDLIPSGYNHEGEFFLACTTSYEIASKLGDTAQDRDYEFCNHANGGAVFSPSKDVCLCEGDTDYRDRPDDQTCQEVCGDAGVAFGGAGAWLENPSVECTTASGQPGVITALGCIPVEQTGITNWIMKFGFFIAGALVVFRIIQGAIMIMTAIGNPDKIQEGKAVITSAIVGLMVILGAVMLLQFIGVDFLGLNIAGLG